MRKWQLQLDRNYCGCIEGAFMESYLLMANNPLDVRYKGRCTHVAFHMIAQMAAWNTIVESIAPRIVDSIDAVIPIRFEICAVSFFPFSPALLIAWLLPAIHTVHGCESPKVIHCESELPASFFCMGGVCLKHCSKSTLVSVELIFATSATIRSARLQFLGENYTLFATRATAEPPCPSRRLRGTNYPADSRQSSVGLACAIYEPRHNQTVPYEISVDKSRAQHYTAL